MCVYRKSLLLSWFWRILSILEVINLFRFVPIVILFVSISSKMLSKDIKHEQEKEKEEKQYLCNECGKLYKQLSSLHRHIKKNHSGENTKRHQCTYCSA